MLPLRGGLAPLTLASSVPVIPWYLSGGISAANCIAAYAPKGAASLAASYSNLANPGTYNAAPGTAPTWDATNGWKFNGSTQYLTTGITPAVAWTYIFKFSNVTNGGYAVSHNRYNYSVIPNAASGVDWNYAGADRYRAPALTSGVLALAANQPYRNGSADGATLANTPTFLSNTSIGCLWNGGPQGGTYWAGYMQAYAIYNTTITAAQVLAVTNAMNAL